MGGGYKTCEVEGLERWGQHIAGVFWLAQSSPSPHAFETTRPMFVTDTGDWIGHDICFFLLGH